MNARLPYCEVINPHLGALLETVGMDKRYVRGEGTRLWDEFGREYLDFLGGYGSVPFGHNARAIWQAVERYGDSAEPSLVQASLCEAATELAHRLLRRGPPNLRYAFFTNSGTEAVEAAIKACRAATGRLGIVAAANGFHGKTLGSLSATGSFKYQAAFGAPVPGFSFVPYGDAEALEATLRQRRGEIAAVLIEPIQGEGGVVVPPAGYLVAVRELCDRYGALLILDEVQTGLGRTGDVFVASAQGVAPDCLTMAKALGGGLVPLGACLMAEPVMSEEFGLKHSSTFGGNAFACRIGLATLDLLEADDFALLGRVRERGEQLLQGLSAIAAEAPHVVRAVRGKGLLIGVDFKFGREAYPGTWGAYLGLLAEQDNLTPIVASYLLNIEGIRTAPTLNLGSVIRVEPPLTVSQAECEALLAAMRRTVGLLARGDTSALVRHLLPDERRGVAFRTPSDAVRPAASAARGDEIARFAFLVHPVSLNNFVEYDESLINLCQGQLQALAERLTPWLEPFVIGQARIEATDGTAVLGDFICVPRIADQLLEEDGDALAVVKRAVDLARSRGAQIVGLGGYTSIATRAGLRVARSDVPVTTGNSFTVLAALWALDIACRNLDIDLRFARVGVVGAGGSIGGALTRLLLPKVGALTLFGNPRSESKFKRRLGGMLTHALAGLTRSAGSGAGELLKMLTAAGAVPVSDSRAGEEAARLLEENGAALPLQWSLDLAAHTAQCDVLVIATSAPETLVEPAMVKPGTVILDLSRPQNVSRGMVERPDVLVIDGGLIEIPGKPDLGWNFGLPPGVAYACMAETMLLAFAGRFQNASLGPDLDDDVLALLPELARTYGFRIAGLRSFDRPLSAVNWEGLRRVRRGLEGGLPAPAAAPVRVGNIVHWLLERHLPAREEQAAVIEGRRSFTYRELFAASQRASRALAGFGLGACDRIALVAHETFDALALLLGAFRLGIACANLNSFLKAEDYPAMLEPLAPRLVVVDSRLAADLAPTLQRSGHRVEVLESWLAAAPSGRDLPAVALPSDAPSIAFFSSGTTGRPKAVLHTHDDLYFTNVQYGEPLLGITAEDTTFSPSKMFFAYGFNSVLLALFAGARAVLAPRKSAPQAIVEMIETHRPTVFFAVPTIYRLILERIGDPVELASVRAFVSAGEALPESIFWAWRRRFGREIIDGIGTTESLCTFISNFPRESQPGCLGHLVPGFSARLVTEDGREANPGEVGVLWLRGPTVARRYEGDPQATRLSFREGWFVTNDLFIQDVRGRYFYLGRANDILKVGGCWVSPADIEAALGKHDATLECAVVPVVEHASLVRPKAYVVLRDGVAPTKELADELRRHAQRVLAPQQYPHYIEFVDALPRTVNGKLQRSAIRARAQPV